MRSIVHFIETGGPGGAERVFLELSIGLRDSGVTVIPATLRTGWLTEQLASHGFPHHLITSRSGFDPLLPLRLRSLIKRTKSELLHTHLLDSNFYGAFAAKLAGVPHIGTEHGDVHHTDKKSRIEKKITWMMRLGTELCAVSRFTADAAERLGARGVKVVGNPLRPAQVTAALREEFRREIRVTNEWVWLHAANFRPVKDQETLIRGFHLALRKSEHRQVLVLAGDGENREKLEALGRELGISELLRFIGFQSEMTPALAGSDGFIMSSLSEALPMAILEAGGAGLYVIGTAVGGVPELLGGGRGGLFQPRDIDGLSREITTALRSKEETARKALSLKNYVLERYSVQAVVGQYLKIYGKR